MDKILFSKKSDNWATPTDFYKKIDEEFKFSLDPCPLNAEFDGLKIDWIGNIFINPPYSNQRAFIEKGLNEIKKGNAAICVYLLPARTDTKLFHELILHKAEIRFIKGRLKFGGGENSAPFPSMLVIYRKGLTAFSF